ncbi:MAG TPA: beta-Ala-His dipeptidase, partial [Clostridia bacterium]|nr:beta-Ala-His dipeptidase [Clostridia bacterium]
LSTLIDLSVVYKWGVKMMVKSLEGLEPRRVFELFSDLCQIPHGSGNEKAISDYIRSFCEKLGLDVYQDQVNNLIIKKPATVGYEECPTVVLQAHMDMVCEKEANVDHDFAKDPIRVLRDGDRIYADGTTLGADNATGVAFAMCVLESKSLFHPPLEVVLTVNEEAGMTGIRALDFNRISGRVIINLDCSDYGIVVGCAGTAVAKMDFTLQREAAKTEMIAKRVRVSGLLGGHSGLDIIKERGNANVLLARFVVELQQNMGIRLVRFDGGQMANAITRESEAVILIDSDRQNDLIAAAEKYLVCLKKELRISDPGVAVTVDNAQCDMQPMTEDTAISIMNALSIIPSGVQTINKEVANLPETSGNIGIVSTSELEFSIQTLYRSGFDSKKRYMLGKCQQIACLVGARYSVLSDSPEWEYKADSRLSALIQRIFKKRFGEELVVEVSHGGNECGSFFRHFPDADIVCTGTQIIGAHTPRESVMVSIIQKEWEMLCLELAGMCDY